MVGRMEEEWQVSAKYLKSIWSGRPEGSLELAFVCHNQAVRFISSRFSTLLAHCGEKEFANLSWALANFSDLVVRTKWVLFALEAKRCEQVCCSGLFCLKKLPGTRGGSSEWLTCAQTCTKIFWLVALYSFNDSQNTLQVFETIFQFVTFFFLQTVFACFCAQSSVGPLQKKKRIVFFVCKSLHSASHRW